MSTTALLQSPKVDVAVALQYGLRIIISGRHYLHLPVVLGRWCRDWILSKNTTMAFHVWVEMNDLWFVLQQRDRMGFQRRDSRPLARMHDQNLTQGKDQRKRVENSVHRTVSISATKWPMLGKILAKAISYLAHERCKKVCTSGSVVNEAVAAGPFTASILS